MSCNKTHSDPYYCGEFYEDESGAWGTWLCSDCRLKEAQAALSMNREKLRATQRVLMAFQGMVRRQAEHLLKQDMTILSAAGALKAGHTERALEILNGGTPV